MSQPACPRCGGALLPSEDGAPPICLHCTPLSPSNADTRTSSGESPAPSPPVDYRGRSFGKYEILEEISRGAMGVVYRAREPLTQRIVALKVLLAGELASGSQVGRFRREVQAAARLRHPGIVPIHDVGVQDDKHYYTMDYIEGRPLSELIAAGEISIRRALELAAQIALALDYAHGEGVVHRDIKPSNVIIDGWGKPHIMDFGLAKMVDSDDRFTRTGTTVGTPSYMPPEQASGESRGVDHRADIYSVGAVLYEMLTGRPPFAGDTMMNTLMQVLNDEPEPPKRLNPRIHHDIQTIVLKAMEKQPDRRYLSAKALADDLQHFVAGESIDARPASVRYRAWKWLKKHQSAVFAAAAILLIVLVAYAVVQQQRKETHQQVKQAREEGKLEGAKDVEAKLKQEQRPTRKIVFSDEFDRKKPGGRWVVEQGAWRTAGGQLRAAARSLAAAHTKQRFTGNVAVILDFVLPPPAARPPRTDGVVGCFLGTDWRHSYRVAVSVRGRPRLALISPREEVAVVECPLLEAGKAYRITLRRTSVGLRVSVAQPGAELRRELVFHELLLPLQLGREFAAGFFAEGAGLHVERFRVEQEFLPLKTGPLQAPEELYRVGNFFEAQKLYEQIAEGHEGRYEGLAALVGLARCEEAKDRPAAAIEHLRRVEARAAAIEHEEVPALLDQARLRRFFCSASLNNFADAVQALSRIAEAQGEVDAGWAWHFPRRIAAFINHRAYDEALGVLRAGVFGPERQTLHGIGASLQAPTLQATLASRARELAEAFCDTGRSEKVRDVYAAWPTPILADVFARAAEDTLRRDQLDEALALLAFCAEQKMASPRLTQAAVDVAGSLCDTQLYTRLADVYAAFPEPQLAPVFRRAIGEATVAGRLDDALALLALSAASFPDAAGALVGADGHVVRLGKAFLARGDLRKPVEIHKALGHAGADPSVASLFVEATQIALTAKRADAAVELLGYARAHFGVAHAGLGAAASRLIGQLAGEGDYEKVIAAHQAYPAESLAPALVKAMTDAVEARRPRAALAVFAQYATGRYELPARFVQALAGALGALDPAEDDTKALLAEYQRVQKIYNTPAARAILCIALGDAYVAAGRLLPALAQYEAGGGFDGLLRAGCVAAELGLGERAIALWADLRVLGEDDAEWAAVAAFLLGDAGTAHLQRAAAAAGVSPAAVAYLRGLRLWLTDASGFAQEFTLAARGKAEWFSPLARRERGSVGEGEPEPPPDEP